MNRNTNIFVGGYAPLTDVVTAALAEAGAERRRTPSRVAALARRAYRALPGSRSEPRTALAA